LRGGSLPIETMKKWLPFFRYLRFDRVTGWLAIVPFVLLLGACSTLQLSPDQNEELFLVEEVIIGMLLVAVLVGIIAHNLRIPYTIGLVLMGLTLAVGIQAKIQVAPNLILSVLVPPLIFEAAFHLNFDDLKENRAYILSLAIGGVLLTAGAAGAIVHWGSGMALSSALVFGAVVAATDPVSVVALFRRMGVPNRLRLLMEGESLFNDGIAVVIFHLVVNSLFSSAPAKTFGQMVWEFLKVSGGGLAIGAILGYLVSEIISRIDDYLIETTLTTILAYGAYLIGELLGVSGVLAVVMAGLINGNIGPRGMSPTTHIVVLNFWEYVAFLANTFVFLLIGLHINLALFLRYFPYLIWSLIAVLITRGLTVLILPRFRHPLPKRWLPVLYWGGLRGAICLALALSLPAQMGELRSQIQVMAFGVVLFTLLVQGTSMPFLIHRLGLTERSKWQEEYERRHARAIMSRNAYHHLERRYRQGLLSEHVWNTLSPILHERTASLTHSVQEILLAEPELEQEELETAWREMLRAERSTLNLLRRDGVITDEIFTQLTTEIDDALMNDHATWTPLFTQFGASKTIQRLLIAVLHASDVENVTHSLSNYGLFVTVLTSANRPFSRTESVLLIGFPQELEETVLKVLQRNCTHPPTYLTTPGDLIQSGRKTPPSSRSSAWACSFEVEYFESF